MALRCPSCSCAYCIPWTCSVNFWGRAQPTHETYAGCARQPSCTRKKKNERMHVIYIKIEVYCNSAKPACSTCAYHKVIIYIYIKGYTLISLYDIATPSLSDGSTTMVFFLTHSCHSVCSCRPCLSLLLFAPSSFISPVTTTGTCTVASNFARPLVLCVKS